MKAFARAALILGLGAVPALTATSAPAQPDTSQASQTISAAMGAIFQGDGTRARNLLMSIADVAMSAKQAEFRACFLSRLDGPPPATPVESPTTHKADAFAASVLYAYRAYWQQALMQPGGRDTAEHTLLLSLGRLLDAPPVASMDEVEPLVEARLQQAGFHVLEGRTGLQRELMLWAKQEDRTYTVTLPETTNETRVVMMDDFASLGWGSYLTCGKAGTGGWTKPDGLFVVVPNYASLTDENFKVNFLAHESQHYTDHKRFPKLESWELEFRAKLVELAYARQTMANVLERFGDDQGDDTGSSHSYANKRVLAALRLRLQLNPDADLSGVPIPILQQAAVAELRADTARRE